jgi:uncharacterized repeat protein (TIGR03803 family)
MKIFRIPLVIVLIVVAGRVFNANAQTETNLYSFGSYANDGQIPRAGLVQGSDGNFYGTTIEGGANGNVGTVFRISASGSYTNLCSFSYSDGAYPRAVLVQGSDGNFYGTTDGGGANGGGTVFRVSPSGNYTNLYSFGSHPNDGIYPDAGLAQGSDGNFYGTTAVGGTYDSGTVFRVSPSGTYSNLHSFAGYPTDGWLPQAALVQSSDSNLYGTTDFGGADNDGTVFRISPSGSETILHSFGVNPNDGDLPWAGLVQGSDGNFYGTTYGGGTNSCSCGTVFRISPSGTETTLYSFVGSPSDGATLPDGLVQGSDGNFYGTTEYGGTTNAGTVFKLSVPLSSPANQISSVQKSASNVIFNISSIAGETYQLQYRSSMTSGIWSNIPGVSVTNSIGALLTLTNFAGATGPQGFYRFAITP